MNAASRMIDCELCVLGTGIAGLNALYAASHYLPKNTRVAVIDKNAAVGGMWQNTYSYVRLHQPHQFFTVGDMKWKLKKDPGYLATRTEIIDHLSDCYSRIKQHFDVIELFSSEFEKHQECSARVQVHVRSNGQSIQINTRQLIKATGLNVRPNDPLGFSSDKVVSSVPEDLDLEKNPDNPVYIIGGGKTAMDTAHAVVRHCPGRPVHMIVGKGTWFIDRQVVAPAGLDRYFKGLTLTGFISKIAERFTGNNGRECIDALNDLGAIGLQQDFQGFLLGILSQEENEAIKKGLSSVITDYLVDVVDTPQGPELVLKNNQSRPVEEGAIFINCTGYLVRDMPDHEPYLSAGKRVLSIQSTSSTLILSTYDSYFLTHMFFRNQLEDSGLYALNFYAVDKKCKHLVSYVACTQMIYNLMIYVEKLPLSVLLACQLNMDLWFPKYRQLFTLCRLLLKKKMLKQHCKRGLDNFESIYQVHCQPLPGSTLSPGSFMLEGGVGS